MSDASTPTDALTRHAGPLHRGPAVDDSREVKDALYQAAVGTARFVRSRPLAALGIMAAVALVIGRSGRDSGHRRGLWR